MRIERMTITLKHPSLEVSETQYSRQSVIEIMKAPYRLFRATLRSFALSIRLVMYQAIYTDSELARNFHEFE